MTLVHSIIIAILQGVSELFPVSSLAHAVLLPKLLHWGLDEKSENWLAFLVALHVGTAIALLIYFRHEWLGVVRALVEGVRRGHMSGDDNERLAWMVLLGTVPAGLVGLFLEHPLRDLFATPYVAASVLVLNGVIMYAGERLLQRQAREKQESAALDAGVEVRAVVGGAGRPRPAVEIAVPEQQPLGQYRDIAQLSWRDAAIVGFAQVGALIPGISRSGATMVAGLAAGLTHEAAARYSFLLATPLITAAGGLEIPKLFAPSGRSVLGYALIGMVLAGIAAYVSVRFLMRYFEGGRLYPFAYYCIGAGVLSLILLTIGL